jgi:feruloyl esterase
LRIDGYKGYKINLAKYLPKNTIIDHAAEGLNQTCLPNGTPAPLPVSLCRLQLTVPTSRSSEIVMEAWLPENWTGRFLATGNGGLSGCIAYADLEYATSYGFAAVGNNGGHWGISGGAFFNQPEVIRDFVGRGLYTSTVVGKAITRQFYGRHHNKAYYIGCSNGGRQGYKAVQSYPELFDGAVLGAPAIDFTGNVAWGGLTLRYLAQNATQGGLTHDDFKEVNEIVLQQCDKLDGAADGILEDNRKCKPDFTAALCKDGNNGSWCLNKAQLNSLTKLYSQFALDGKIIHGGLTPGSELDHTDPENVIGLRFMIAECMQFVVKADLNYDLNTFNEQDARDALQANPDNVRTFEGDLSRFRDRGGKVIHWHGQNDEVLSVTTSDRYYDHVSKTMRASPSELDRFYRYFRISGMNHCNHGLGASNIGQEWDAAVSNNPDDNVLLRIIEWVENGRGPEILRGHKYVNLDKAQGIEFSRKHCKHPKVNKYFGRGNGKDEAGWRCVDKY